MIRYLTSGGANSSADARALEEMRDTFDRRLSSLEEEFGRRVSFLEAETMRARRTALMAAELQGFEAALRGVAGKRILIAGWYGADNLGDELMLRAVLEHLPQGALSRTAVLLWDNSTYDRMTLDARIHAVHYPATTRELDALVSHFDVVVWGGGAILDDKQFNNDVNNFNTGNLFIRINDLMLGRGKQVYCLGLSANETITDQRYLSKLRFIVEKASHFSLRDKKSAKLLASLGMPEDKLSTCEDLVFSMRSLRDVAKMPDEEFYTLGLVPFYADGLLDTYANVVRQSVSAAGAVAKDKRLRVMLIPFLNEGGFDERMNAELKRLVESRVTGCEVELATYEPNPAASPICKCDSVVCYKYHAALIACCAGVPCLMVSRSEHAHYANKMAHLAELAGIEYAQVPSAGFEEGTEACMKAFFASACSPKIDECVYANMDAYMGAVCQDIAS